MIVATTTSGAYKVVLFLHLLAAIVGFGSVFLNDLYGAAAKRRNGAEGVAIAETTYQVGKVAQYFIYAVPILGIALVGMSDKTWKFSQLWISLSFLLYIVGLALALGLHLPNVKRMNALSRQLVEGGSRPGATSEPPPEAAELEARQKRAAALGGILNLVMMVILVLMVWKPGS